MTPSTPMPDTETSLCLGQSIKTGIDGKQYVVFPSSYELNLYLERDPHKRYAGMRIACFGQYENAICLEPSHA